MQKENKQKPPQTTTTKKNTNNQNSKKNRQKREKSTGDFDNLYASCRHSGDKNIQRKTFLRRAKENHTLLSKEQK